MSPWLITTGPWPVAVADLARAMGGVAANRLALAILPAGVALLLGTVLLGAVRLRPHLRARRGVRPNPDAQAPVVDSASGS